MDWCLWFPCIFLASLHFYVLFTRWPKDVGHRITFRQYAADICLFFLLINIIVRLGLSSYTGRMTIKYGALANIPLAAQRNVLKIVYANGYIYDDLLWIVKLTFLAMYYRMWVSFEKRTRQFFHITLLSLIVGFLFDTCCLIFFCLPVRRNWIIGPDYCSLWQSWGLNLTGVILSIVVDIEVMGLGWLVVRKLQMTRGLARGAYLIFILGAITIVAAIIRIIAFSVQPATDQQGFEFAALGTIFVEVELALGGIAATLPGLRVFLRSYGKTASQISYDAKAGGPGLPLGTMPQSGLPRTGDDSQTHIIPDEISHTSSVRE